MHSLHWLKQALNDRDAIVSMAAIDFGDTVEKGVDLTSKNRDAFPARGNARRPHPRSPM